MAFYSQHLRFRFRVLFSVDAARNHAERASLRRRYMAELLGVPWDEDAFVAEQEPQGAQPRPASA